MKIRKRLFELNLPAGKSAFLWGPRKVGKTYWISYFDILEDTYLGFRIPPWKKSKNRRMITTEKFYLFDVGVANYLLGDKELAIEIEGSSRIHFQVRIEHYDL